MHFWQEFCDKEIFQHCLGLLNGKDKKVNGKLEIPNLSDENSADEIDVSLFS